MEYTANQIPSSLKNRLKDFSKEYINEINDWYTWRVDESKLPIDEIKLPIGNSYKRNISLKTELNKHWLKENQEVRNKIIIYYIKTWGGVQGNNEKTMSDYTTKDATELISKGKIGVASWSKAICIHNPDKYAIFDARVSISLNCLQIIGETQEKVLFPLLASRNKKIIAGNKFIKNIAKTENWKPLDDFEFYNQYLQLISEVANELNLKIVTIEMLLFAYAEDLVEKVL